MKTQRAIFELGLLCRDCMYHIVERVRFTYNGKAQFNTRRVCGRRENCPYAVKEGGKSDEG